MTRSKSPDLASWFGPVLETLRAAYGDDVQVGTSIDLDYLELLEKQLGAKFPADYRAFLTSYGFVRVHDTIIYGVPMSTTRDADAVDLRRAIKAFDALVVVRSDRDDVDFVKWCAERRAVIPVIGCIGAFDDDAHGHVRGDVYALDARGKLWDLTEVIPEPTTSTFRALVERLASSLGDQRRKPADDEDLDDPTLYRRLIPISALSVSAIEECPDLADDVALQRSGDEVIELRRHIPALLEVLHGTDQATAIARAVCGDHDLVGPEMQTRMFSPPEVSELATALANIVEDVRAAALARPDKLAALRSNVDAVIELATRVRDAYRGASQDGSGMMVRYSRI
jgi:hypothetical protein